MVRRSRNYMFTLFRNEDGLLPEHDEIIDKVPHQFIIFQVERCPRTQRIHVQGYVHLKYPKGLQATKKLFRDLGDYWERTVHLEEREGSHDQAKAYCSKLDTRISGPWSHGEEPEQGKTPARKELLSKATDLDRSVEDIAEEDLYTYAINEKAFNIARQMQHRIQQRQEGYRHVVTVFFWGETRTGKSRLAAWMGNRDNHRAYRTHQPTDSKIRWAFNNYDGEDTLIIEDGWWDNLRMPDLLKILDGHPYQQYAMYGQVYPRWKRVFITSNDNPDSWGGMHAQRGALQARLTHRLFFDKQLEWNADGSPEFDWQYYESVWFGTVFPDQGPVPDVLVID